MPQKLSNNFDNQNWLTRGEAWSLFWRVFSTVFIPATVPWLLFKLLRSFHRRSKFKNLAGKVVLITGASSGLGEALAHVFYSQGCKIVLAARRKDELERVKNDLLQTHPTVPTYPPVVIQMDLSNLDGLSKIVQSILSIFGQIDILINNAGISFRGTVIETNLDVHQKVMMINYFGQVALIKAVLPSMISRNKGHIVAISSVQGRIAIPNRSAYTASKHALQAFCDSLRAEIASQGLKVTVVSPGYIRTNLSINAVTETGETHGVMDETTLNGYSPEYVAKEILKSVVNESPELVITQLNSYVAIFLRILVPSIYFRIMAKRANRQE